MSHQRRSTLPPELAATSLPRRSAHQSNGQLLVNLNLPKVEETQVVATLFMSEIEDAASSGAVEIPTDVKTEDSLLAVDEKLEEVAVSAIEEVLPEQQVQVVDTSKSKTKRKV